MVFISTIRIPPFSPVWSFIKHLNQIDFSKKTLAPIHRNAFLQKKKKKTIKTGNTMSDFSKETKTLEEFVLEWNVVSCV